jgi:YaiO family outer membrane protein
MIRRLGWTILAVALLSMPVLAQDEEQAARKLVTEQKFAEARAVYEGLLKLDPDNVDYLNQIARLSAWMKEYATATEIFDRVLKREPRNAEALVGKAYVEMWQRHYPAAEELLAQAKKLSPEDVDVEMALARLCHYQNRERAAKDHVARAIKLDPNNSEAQDLKGEIDPPRPVEVKLGFNQDRFSFTTPGNMGFVSAGYIGESNQITLQYEEWSLFGERTRRAGLNFEKKLADGWWLRAGTMNGPGAVVVPRQEYTAGASHALPKHFALDLDYQLMRFRAADVHVASPVLTYYFTKPVWVSATYDNGWTEWRTGVTPGQMNHSWVGQFYEQVAKPLVLHVGFARGSEDFEALTVDRLGVFLADTYLAGAEFRITRGYSAELFCSYQTRSDHEHQTSFGVNFTAKQ